MSRNIRPTLPPLRRRPHPVAGQGHAHVGRRSVRDLQGDPLGGDDGEPFCPKCGCVAIYTYRARRLFKCQACHGQFSVTSGSIFASRKMALRDILAAIAIFVNGAKGHSALQLSRDLDCQYKTAFVLLHKLREALGAPAGRSKLAGEVEVDGAYFGGYVKPANRKANRVDRRLAMHRTGKRQVVIVMRERDGETLPFVAKSEAAGVADHRCQRRAGRDDLRRRSPHGMPWTPAS